MGAPQGAVERRGLFGLSDREWGNQMRAVLITLERYSELEQRAA